MFASVAECVHLVYGGVATCLGSGVLMGSSALQVTNRLMDVDINNISKRVAQLFALLETSVVIVSTFIFGVLLDTTMLSLLAQQTSPSRNYKSSTWRSGASRETHIILY